MDTSRNSQLDFRTRLIAFLVVLAVGFAMGWFNNSGTDTNGLTSRDATPDQTAEIATDDESSDDEADGAVESSDEQQSTPAQDTTEDNADVTEPSTTTDDSGSSTVAPTRGPTVEKNGWYTSKDEVALYIHTYGRLPGNFISKTKARNRGWVSTEGNLDEVCPGMSIGGSRYYNDDGTLPEARGRTWTECDINYEGGYRGAERIVFSNDGLIFYTDDHYETFEQLY